VGIVTDVNPLQPQNDAVPIFETPIEMINDVRLVNTNA
jgi:hypothetical protein